MDDITATDATPSRSSKWLRRLRIAASVFFALVTVSLCVLWVRSYWWVDDISFPITQTRGGWLASNSGQVSFALTTRISPVPQTAEWESYESQWGRGRLEREDDAYAFVFGKWNSWTIWGPHWMAIFIVLAFGTVPWIRFRRFSLRTILTVMTLVAVVLGLMVWAAR